MSITCKFGDEEEWEEVKCTYDHTTDQVLCREPLRRRGNGRGQLVGAKMEVILENSGPRTVNPLVHMANSDEEIEMTEISRTKASASSEEASKTTSLSQAATTDSGQSLSGVRRWMLDAVIGCIGETFGTMLMTVIICTVLASSIITGSQLGVWQVALPSGLAVSIGIYLSAHISEGHLNPAVTLAFSIVRWKQFYFYKTIPYLFSQMLGAFFAAGTVYLFYYEAIADFETTHNITKGEDGSQLTATIFARYFPNPVVYSPRDPTTFDIVPVWKALLVETWGTFILVFVIFGLTHPYNTTLTKNKAFVPVMVGITIATLISIYGPLTQCGINPAFDFGPRLFAAMAGWGRIAIPGPRNGFWVYFVGPLIGGPLGGGTIDLIQCVVIKLRNKVDSK